MQDIRYNNIAAIMRKRFPPGPPNSREIRYNNIEKQ